MPGNWGYLGEDVKYYLTQNFDKKSTVLDVGCGHGFYYKLLNHHFEKIDAVEVWDPYIQEYDLRSMYDNVYNTNILDFEFDYYDIIIMGDILEHIDLENAKNLLNKLINKCREIIVVVPYNLPQDEVFGNKYEIHLQPNLSDVVMETEYPMLELININGRELKLRIDVGDNIYHYCAFKKKI
jgi:hypothetical protein